MDSRGFGGKTLDEIHARLHNMDCDHRLSHHSQRLDILYVVTNVLTMVMALLKICIIVRHKREFLNLIIYMHQNFWNVDYDFREKEILNNCKRTCAFFIFSVTSIGICAMLCYLITPILGRFTKLCNPKHEISEVTLSNHVYKFYEKLKLYIRHHQLLINYCKRLETVYTMIIFGQAAAPTARSAIFKFLLIDSMALLFMFTYGCDGVIEHSEKIALGAYSALWTIMPMNKSGRMLRNDLLLVIERSRRVCCLTANGFFPISLETYTKILSTAMSYLTLLRNRLENVAND
ncbi:hypothetical protein K0M31_001613 [Melipona bicolor]|uniref:Odorant receptor n=1 Tax=Melipona bicolor TaxID=60889 RepID=A0AA40GFV2_9HYME|nr:hypothetical protein K0M31_001613 [Melipona bicolor]